MKTAGLVLDFYDDLTGEILKTICPTAEDLPGAVKTAHFLNSAERDVLRDEAFALILHNDGQTLRKFACIDEGNTVLSTAYFMETMDRLPAEAIKTAAANLVSFNQDFKLPVPEILKFAAVTGMARKRNSDLSPAVVGDEADWAQRTNLLSIRGGSDSGRVIPTVNQMKTASIPKGMETANTSYARMRRSASKFGRMAAENTDLKSVSGWQSSTGRRYKDAAKKLLPSKVANVVDVSNLTPEPVVLNKRASITALSGHYSLDSYSDVKDAIRFFEDGWTVMDPRDRHEFAVKTAARAEELGIQVPDMMARYGGTSYGPDIDAHLANRRAVAPQFSAVWEDLQEKRAMIEPAAFAELLREADEMCFLNHEWGGAVFDPYYATFGGEAEKLAWNWASADGDHLDEKTLRAIPSEELVKAFTPDVAHAFALDPVTIFESMPDTHKAIISRMARPA